MGYPKGRPRSAESKAKTAESMRKHYEEDPTARERRASFKGRKHSKETRKKMSESARVVWAKRPADQRAKPGPPRTGEVKACLICGTEFYLAPSETGSYCSRQHAGEARRGVRRPDRAGRIRNAGGYMMIRQDDGKYKMEHRIILEEKIGRPMLAHETVHHRNGIRDDNRPENLELRTGKHGKGATKHCPTCTCG